nr:Magnetosome protein MamK [uncultured bacterium]
MSGNKLLLGIDLGTSHTAIMSNRGAKGLVRSVVGYPKDVIGLKLLGRPYVVGNEAYDLRSYLDLRYPLEDGVLAENGERDIEVARHMLSHVIKMADAKPDDEVYAVIGVPARATGSNKSLLLKMAQEVVHTAMVVSEPFMVAYGLNKLLNAIVVDIGAGTVDLCALKGTVPAPEDQVTLTKAGNYVDERLQNAILERYPDIQMNVNVACAIKEAHSFVGSPSSPVVVDLRAAGKPVSCDVTDALKVACEAPLPDIIESIQTLIQTFQPEYQEMALKNIIIAGGGSRIKGLASYIQNSLRAYGNAEVVCVNDPTYDGCRGALRLAEELPPQYWGQLGEIAS